MRFSLALRCASKEANLPLLRGRCKAVVQIGIDDQVDLSLRQHISLLTHSPQQQLWREVF